MAYPEHGKYDVVYVMLLCFFSPFRKRWSFFFLVNYCKNK